MNSIETLLIAMSIPSAVTGFCFWWLEHKINRKEVEKQKKREQNEKAYVEDMLQDILDLICRKESLQVEKEEKLAVYSVQKGSFLKKSRTLEEHRVQSGENIMIL